MALIRNISGIEKWTFYSALLVVGLTPVDALQIFPGAGITYGRIAFIIMLFFSVVSGKLFKVKSRPYIKYLIAFTIWASFTTLWSFTPSETLYRSGYLIQYLLIVLLLDKIIDSPAKLRYACFAWTLGVIYISIMSISDFQANANVDLYRVTDFGNPNENSFMLCYACILLCVMFRNNLTNIALVTFLLFAFAGVVVNGSRNGFIMYLMIVAVYAINFYHTNKIKALLLIPLLLGVGIYVFFHYVPESTVERFLGIKDELEYGTMSSRSDIWDDAIDTLTSGNNMYALFGSGWGSFMEVHQALYGKYIGSHNYYLNLLFTTGIIGLGIILAYLKKLFLLIKDSGDARYVDYLLLFVPMLSMCTTNWESRRWPFLIGFFIYQFSYCISTKQDIATAKK